MREKTYLTPDRQLEWPLSFVLGAWRQRRRAPMSNPGWFFGMIVQLQRLFRRDDIVLVRLSNGQAERQSAWGVSSKGFRVVEYFMQHAAFRGSQCSDAGPSGEGLA